MATACGVGDDGGGPVGADFDLTRTQTSATPCPSFAQEDASHTISVRSGELLVDGIAATEIAVLSTGANPDRGDAPNIVFTTREAWTSSDGAVTPSISYRLWADSTGATGTASTTFAFDTDTTATDCTYAWTVTGARTF